MTPDPWVLASILTLVLLTSEETETAVAAMPAIYAAGTHALAIVPLCIVLLSLSFSVHPHS